MVLKESQQRSCQNQFTGSLGIAKTLMLMEKSKNLRSEMLSTSAITARHQSALSCLGTVVWRHTKRQLVCEKFDLTKGYQHTINQSQL